MKPKVRLNAIFVFLAVFDNRKLEYWKIRSKTDDS